MAEHKIVSADEDGQRLDRWLKKHFPLLAFGVMQKILRTGQVRVNGKRSKGETRLATGQQVRIPPQISAEPETNNQEGVSEKDAGFIQSLVLYRDQNIIAINKPSGLATQGGTGITRHIDGMLEALSFDGEKPRLVHRLDRDTSGVLLLARNLRTAGKLGELFKGRDIRKYYWAVTVPAPERLQGKIDTLLAKQDDRDAEKMAVVDRTHPQARHALTFYNVMDRAGDEVAWIAFWPRTGRTHQIRVHAAHMGTPIMGDYKYGYLSEEDRRPSLHLHARRIILPASLTGGKKIDITAPLPPAMQKTFKFFGFAVDDQKDPFKDLD